jgi:hypothetical protein
MSDGRYIGAGVTQLPTVLISGILGGGIAFVVLTVIVLALIHRILRRWRTKPLKARLRELDQIWIQIHSVEPEESGEEEQGEQEGEEEVGLLEN